jgi:GNAT superfamily N-acetyltransferase
MNVSIRPANANELPVINEVISAAALAWPLADRVKRLSLHTLLYDAVDFQNMEMFVACLGDLVVGVAAWDPDHSDSLLHGLYVEPSRQKLGIGEELMRHVYEHARERGKSTVLIRAERVSAAYFERQSLERLEVTADEYPYQYLKRLA